MFLTAAQPSDSSATEWRLIAVAQPLLQEGDFLTIGDVHYGTDTFTFGAEVALTCEPNSIRMIGEDPEEEVEDLNAASRFGMSVKVAPIRDDGARIDTMRVTLDATRVAGALAARNYPCPPDSIVEATVLCIRLNAARSARPPKFVKLKILGPPSLQRFTGVHSVMRGGASELDSDSRFFDACAPVEQKQPPHAR